MLPSVAHLALDPPRVGLVAEDRPNRLLVALRHWQLVEAVEKQRRLPLASGVVARELLRLGEKRRLKLFGLSQHAVRHL